jgi:uncharacterized membrane protein
MFGRWIDRGLSVLLILGGIGHTFGVLDYYKNPDTLFWALTASLLIFILAAVNLLRTWRPGDRALAWLTACASAAYFIFTLRFGQLIGNLADFRVILFGVLTLGLAGFGLREAMRRSAS